MAYLLLESILSPIFCISSFVYFFIYNRNLTTLTGIRTADAKHLLNPPVMKGTKKLSQDILSPV